MAGHAAGTPAVMPVTYNDTIPYAKKYQDEDRSRAQGARVGDRDARRRRARRRPGDGAPDWLTAHLQYETLGDAYGRSAASTPRSTAGRIATGVNSPQWTGFFRLEYGLWHGQSLTSLAPVAATLDST